MMKMTDDERHGVKMLRAISQASGKDRCSKECLKEWQRMSAMDKRRTFLTFKEVDKNRTPYAPNVSFKKKGD